MDLQHLVDAPCKVRCDTEDCPQVGKQRIARIPWVGDRLYMEPRVICADCGNVVTNLGWQTKQEADAEYAELVSQRLERKFGA